jgi:cyanophycinase
MKFSNYSLIKIQMKHKTLILIICLLLLKLNSGSSQTSKNEKSQPDMGHLFIIGGGDKTGLMQDMLKTSGITANDYIIVLPMSSEIPDSSIIWAKEDFASVGANNVIGFNFLENGPVLESQLDSIRKTKLIFISGGDQSRFMKVVGKGPIYSAIHEAYKNGSTIAGTSAGAAVMSKKMITGNTLKHEYTSKYPSIEADNIEITEGLGLLENVIVDQHFIKRQRLNRLMAVVIENPSEFCVGIDESTAIVVSGNSFRVSGENQVVVLRNPKKDKRVQSGLLGSKGLVLDLLLPGETYKIK